MHKTGLNVIFNSGAIKPYAYLLHAMHRKFTKETKVMNRRIPGTHGWGLKELGRRLVSQFSSAISFKVKSKI